MKQVIRHTVFCVPEQGMIQIIGNINEVRATSIFDVFDIKFFRAKVVMMQKLVVIHLLKCV